MTKPIKEYLEPEKCNPFFSQNCNLFNGSQKWGCFCQTDKQAGWTKLVIFKCCYIFKHVKHMMSRFSTPQREHCPTASLKHSALQSAFNLDWRGRGEGGEKVVNGEGHRRDSGQYRSLLFTTRHVLVRTFWDGVICFVRKPLQCRLHLDLQSKVGHIWLLLLAYFFIRIIMKS